MTKKIIAFGLMLLMISGAFAQNVGGNQTTTSYQNKGGVITFPVQIWGEVARPGVYEIPIGSDFLAAISYAGGPTELAKLTDVRLIRAKLLDGETDPMVKVDIEQYLLTGDKKMLPEVRLGDTIIVAPRFMKGVRTTMTYIQSILSIVNVIILIQYYQTR